MIKAEKLTADCKHVWVFVEIQDHERILEGSLEILSKGRELAQQLGEKLYAIVFGLECEKYLDELKQYSPDGIIFSSNQNLKHYNGEIFPDMITELINTYKPSIMLFPSTEAGKDLAPRLAARYNTGLTAHCSDLDIMESDDYSQKLLLMKRPAFSGNVMASILCPHTRPQFATVQRGIFKKNPLDQSSDPEMIEVECKYQLKNLKVVDVEDPIRWERKPIPLEQSAVIITGGSGMGTKEQFDKLHTLSNILGAEVGATRVPVFNEWIEEDNMIGQTGKTVKPDLYINFGVSGQIQHTSAIVDSKRIISINNDPDAPINEISDYVITEDVKQFLPRLIERIGSKKK
jgi:electron transfer flavoprotein alpha subunit